MKQKNLLLLIVMIGLWLVNANTELKQQTKHDAVSCAHARSITLINPLFPFIY